MALLNDDCGGWAFDALFDGDRASLRISVVVHAVQEFGLDLSELRPDLTSDNLTGAYTEANRGLLLGKPTVALRHPPTIRGAARTSSSSLDPCGER